MDIKYDFYKQKHMKVQYVLVDTEKTFRAPTCTTCLKDISETTIWYSFRGTDDLCFECWNVIRNLSIIPENNTNRPIDSSILDPLKGTSLK